MLIPRYMSPKLPDPIFLKMGGLRTGTKLNPMVLPDQAILAAHHKLASWWRWCSCHPCGNWQPPPTWVESPQKLGKYLQFSKHWVIENLGFPFQRKQKGEHCSLNRTVHTTLREEGGRTKTRKKSSLLPNPPRSQNFINVVSILYLYFLDICCIYSLVRNGEVGMQREQIKWTKI